MTDTLPRVLFFNINGSGLGHLSRCLAYARRMKGRASPVFFSLAAAVEVIHAMGFEADYLVSPFWSRSHINAWNRELAVRMGLILEEVKPEVAVFDGTWPFPGFMQACEMARIPHRVWSNRGLHRKDFQPVPVKESSFDLVIEPGEIGTGFALARAARPGRKVRTPPVALMRQDELLSSAQARDSLALSSSAKLALFSLGPGNLKDVSEIARGLIGLLRSNGFTIVWAQAPISVRDPLLPEFVVPISVFPLVRYMRAFDVFVSAAGYNACCEIVQSGVPSLLVPNTLLADDQARRAEMVSRYVPVVVSDCETPGEREEAVARLLRLRDNVGSAPNLELDGAERAVDEILGLVGERVAA